MGPKRLADDHRGGATPVATEDAQDP